MRGSTKIGCPPVCHTYKQRVLELETYPDNILLDATLRYHLGTIAGSWSITRPALFDRLQAGGLEWPWRAVNIRTAHTSATRR